MRMKMKPFEAHTISGLYCCRNDGDTMRKSASKPSEYATSCIEFAICHITRSPSREVNMFFPSENVITPRLTMMCTW